MDSLLERLTRVEELLMRKGIYHKRKELGALIGKSPSQISGAFSGNTRYLTVGLLKKIAETFPQLVNKEYMLTGEGQISLVEDSDNVVFVAPEEKEPETRPHFSSIRVAAGYMSGVSQDSDDYELREVPSHFPDYDFSVDVTGNSMDPEIQDGDTIYCTYCKDSLNPPVGKICVLDTYDGATVKIIERIGRNSLVLHSINPEYEDYSVNFEDIYNVAKVVAIFRPI